MSVRSRRRRRALLALALAAVTAVVPRPPALASDYRDAGYLQFDLDNVSRSTARGRQLDQETDPSYAEAAMRAGAEVWFRDLGRQLAALPELRLFLGLGQLIPGGAVGDPNGYFNADPHAVDFLSRTGALLRGYLFWDGLPGAHPGVVITPGSLQGVQQGYWWAARSLARNGYVVLTFDVQGQGESEVFGHDPGRLEPTGEGFPSQQADNFVDGTVDALRFLLSTPADPYVPGGWTAASTDAAQRPSDGTLEWTNPLAAFLDRTRVGLAGHSLGASAVSVVQQCSDESDLWQTLGKLCAGRSYPIRAAIAWDGFSETLPVVPTMTQQADGYFLNPQPSPRPPAPGGHLDVFRQWRHADVDVYSYTTRGGTHLEWWNEAVVGSATRYGVFQETYYTIAWFERYLRGEPDRQWAGFRALLTGPIPDNFTHGATEHAWRANFMSARSLGAFDFSDPGGARYVAIDLRAYAGLSPVGDWAGANADNATSRELT